MSRKLRSMAFIGLVWAAGVGASSACDTSAETPWPSSEGGIPAFAACNEPGQCVALVPGCCGVCGSPALEDVVGVNVQNEAAFRATTCNSDAPACPKCAQSAEPNLVAFCENARCTPLDLRRDTLSACVQNEDCTLRYADCCESCSEQPSSVVAVATRNLRLYAAEICPVGKSCPACAPHYPVGWTAACGQSGHCQVVAPQ